jgi:hypothetical protein
LIALEYAFSTAKNASNYIKSVVVNPKILKPTQGGRAAEKLASESERDRLKLGVDAAKAQAQIANKANK